MAVEIYVDHTSLRYSLVIEDDDRVAYAYLLWDGEIVGDVWLSNCGPAPDTPEWRDATKAPFANPTGFSSGLTVAPITKETEVEINWQVSLDTVVGVELSAHGRLLAVLAPGAKPGWSVNAIKDGPLAKILTAGN